MKTKIAAAIGLTVFCAGVALAADHTGKMHDGMRPDAPKTRAEVEAKVKAHFAEMDADKDGFVTTEERTAARAARMVSAKDAHFKAMDTNNDGAISRAEFDAGRNERAAKHGGARHGRKQMIMDRVDADKNGKLSLAEALTGPLARFDRIDTDKNGTISDAERAAHRDMRKERRSKWRERRG